MHIIVCLDDRDGMLFNKRRQSSDRMVCADMLEQAGQQLLRVSPYSAKLFSEYPDRILIAEDPLAECPSNGICFLENTPLDPYLSSVTKLTVYRWNRAYPGDRQFPVQAFTQWQLVARREFAGSSHENITQEVYAL